jgi:hypothetical protein
MALHLTKESKVDKTTLNLMYNILKNKIVFNWICSTYNEMLVNKKNRNHV